MKKLIKLFSKAKLNLKFTIVIGMIVFLPILAIITVIFNGLNEDLQKYALNNLKYSMAQTHGTIQKTVDLCNTSTQVYLNYNNLRKLLKALKENEEIESTELVSFYKNDIAMLENIVNSNPYLYQTRVYAFNEQMSEMMPILFRSSRLEKFSWAENFESGKWVFDYSDELALSSINSSNHCMALITKIEDYDAGTIGIIEVAVRMEDVFETIFDSNGTIWNAFVDQNGIIYSGASSDEVIWEYNKEEVIAQINFDAEEQYEITNLFEKDVAIGVVPVKELSGTFIQIINLEQETRELQITKLYYSALIFLIFLVLIFVINFIVKMLLKKYYMMLNIVNNVAAGDLDARVSVIGEDEMGVFAKQINIMLDTIQQLMKDSIEREVLMKNSEIKALQNQINAHFIYNVLESIKMMAEIDEKYEISDAVTSLGKLLRYGMKWSVKNVSVGQEIEYIKDYLTLINLRFDYEIHLSVNVSPTLLHLEIPKITLQPIVENAIYHGIEELAQDASIYIKAYVKEQDCFIEITDSGKGMSEQQVTELENKIKGEIETSGGAGNGIGLKNVQDRIQISFGEKYGIHVQSKKDCFTKVIVRLPIKSGGSE
ncbi:MAG: sensor histidine kinase [Lachnospiraceae bacterium]